MTIFPPSGSCQEFQSGALINVNRFTDSIPVIP